MFHPQLKTITDWNPAAEKIFGYQRSEVLGRNGFEVLLEAGSHVREDQIVELLRKGEMAYSINRNVTKDGRSILCEWHNTTLRDAAGEVIAVMSMVQDVTERKQVQAERERLLESERLARTEAERATHIKDEFLATVSHELRSPLTAIVGWADVIRHGKATQGQIEHGVEVIRRNALTQAQLIGDLLDLSRIVTGKMRLTPEVVDLAAVIHAAVELVKPSADARTIEISCSIEPLSERVHGDPARLQQIVGNLLSNAVKFTPRGGRIELTLLRAEEHLEVRVSDTGKGIPADFLPHVFERFRQGDASAAGGYGGLGIGLALVRELTQLHGGEVSAASDGEGKGATFTVKLPVAARQREPHPEASAAVPPGVIPGAARLEGVRVLLVDDEPDALEVIQRILEDRHAEVTPLRSADAALSLLAAGASFDVLLADIGMPGRDGYEFITDVRKLGIRTPAAALTALARSEDRTRALYTGFQAHLTKPAQASELLATVASLIGRMDR
jgi:PAS domain S-box-containing protein